LNKTLFLKIFVDTLYCFRVQNIRLKKNALNRIGRNSMTTRKKYFSSVILMAAIIVAGFLMLLAAVTHA